MTEAESKITRELRTKTYDDVIREAFEAGWNAFYVGEFNTASEAYEEWAKK